MLLRFLCSVTSPPCRRCLRFGVQPCVAGKASQQWELDSGAKPGDGQPTQVKSAVKTGVVNDADLYSCWQTNFQFAPKMKECGLHNGGVDCDKGCAPSHADCPKTVEWSFLANGSITNGQLGKKPSNGGGDTLCLTKGDSHGSGSTLSVQPCNGSPHQTWKVTSAAGSEGGDGDSAAVTVEQNGSCVENNFVVPPGGYMPKEQGDGNGDGGALFPWTV